MSENKIVMVRINSLPVSVLEEYINDEIGINKKISIMRSNRLFMEALWIASPTFAGELELLNLDEEIEGGRLDAIYRSLTQYVMRMTTRSTPFGLFAGVSSIPVLRKSGIEILVSNRYRKSGRLGSFQVGKAVSSLEPLIFKELDLKIYFNPSYYVKGDRVHIPFRSTNTEDSNPAMASMNYTTVVQCLVHICERPISALQVVKILSSHFPEVPIQKIELFLSYLIKQEYILTSLRPPMTCTDPSTYILSQLPEDNQTKEIIYIKEVHQILDSYNRSQFGDGVEILKSVYAVCDYNFSESQKTIQVDLFREAEGYFSGELIDTLEEAILAIGLCYDGEKDLDSLEYKNDFLEKYGDRRVSILEMLDKDYGLGAPAGFMNPPTNRARKASSRVLNDMVINHIIDSIKNRNYEVDLSEIYSDIQLDQQKSNVASLIPLDCIVNSYTIDDRSEICLVNVAEGAGSTFGRFCHLDERLHQYLIRESTKEKSDAVIHADTIYLDTRHHINNVAIHPKVYDFEISLSTTPSDGIEGSMGLNDIYVGLTDGHFYFWSKSYQKEVVPRAPHVLNTLLAPNHIRFMLEAGKKFPYQYFWDWAQLGSLTHLPTIRYKDVVIANQRWIVPSAVRNIEQLKDWLSDNNVPRYVYAGKSDNKLVFDTRFHSQLHNLILILQKDLPILEECIGGYQGALVKDTENERFFSQFCIPVFCDTNPDFPIVNKNPLVEYTTTRNLAPLYDWTYFKLYCKRDDQDDVVRSLYNTLGEDNLDEIKSFFIRYADPKDHIRFRINCSYGNHLFPKVVSTIEDLQKSGRIVDFSINTYERELERYGGDKIHLFEEIFYQDSLFVSGLVSRKIYHDHDRVAVTSATIYFYMLQLGVDPRRILLVVEHMCSNYLAEFMNSSIDRAHIDQVNKTDLREQRPTVWKALGWLFPPEERDHLYEPSNIHIYKISSPFPSSHDLTDAQLASLIHMHANRAGLDRFAEFRSLKLLGRVIQGFNHYMPKSINPNLLEVKEL